MPAAQAVTADSPVPQVVLRVGGGIAGTHDAVDVQPQAVNALGGDKVMPAVVVVGLGRRDGARATGIGSENQLPRVGHVDVAVVGPTG